MLIKNYRLIKAIDELKENLIIIFQQITQNKDKIAIWRS